MCVTIRRRFDEDNILIYIFIIAPRLYIHVQFAPDTLRTSVNRVYLFCGATSGKPLCGGGLSPPLASRSEPGRRDTTVLRRAG